MVNKELVQRMLYQLYFIKFDVALTIIHIINSKIFLNQKFNYYALLSPIK